MASRAAKITIRVIGSLLALILVAVLALVGWAMFRPLLQGDFNHTYGYIRTVSTLSETPLSAMVASVGTPTSADGEDELNNRISNTLGQVEVIQEDVKEAQESRAGSKDDEVRAELEQLGNAYDDLTATFESWQANGYAVIGAAAKACQSSQQECQQAASSVEGLAPQDESLASLQQAVTEAANSGSTTDIEAALRGMTDRTGALWSTVEEGLASVTDILAERGAEVDD